MTAAIRLTRDPGGWVDRLRAYQVVVNGQVRAELRAGEYCVVDVEPGPAEVFLRLDFGKSQTIRLDVPDGLEEHLRCRARSWLTALYGISFGRNRYMRLEKVPMSGQERRPESERP
jgi:hypothetical protein